MRRKVFPISFVPFYPSLGSISNCIGIKTVRRKVGIRISIFPFWWVTPTILLCIRLIRLTDYYL